MAKKKTVGAFNMSAEVRAILKEKPRIKGRELFETLCKKFPKQKVNKESCLVAFSTSRKKMGLSRKTGRKKVVRWSTRGKQASVANLEQLQAAADFVSKMGDADTAIAAIQQVKSLQIG